jgi:hypothetical protein
MKNRPPAEITVEAKTDVANRALEQVVQRPWATNINTDAETDKAMTKIEAIVTREWKSSIDTDAKTDAAQAAISRITSRVYNATVDVDADTTQYSQSIQAATNRLASTLTINANVGTANTVAATGRIFPGYAPWQDKILTLVSPGEAVLRPQAVRALGPDIINALNNDWNRVAKRLKGSWDGIPRMATGGIATGSMPTVGDFMDSLTQIRTIARSGTDFTVPEGTGSTTSIREGDTWQIFASEGMSVNELAETISRKQAFQRRRGTT